jgi:hypothetical protein
MSEPSTDEVAVDPIAQSWLEGWRYASALGRGGLAALTTMWNPRQVRSWWFAHLSQNIDTFLRSPPFLELMSCNLRTMTRSARMVLPFSPPRWRSPR